MTQPNSAVAAVREDFRNFLYIVWKHLGLPDPTPVQYEIAEYLQHGPKRSAVEAFRGVGKSWITSAFVPWCLLNDPNLNVAVISASKTRADEFSTFVRRLIREIPVIQHLEPGPHQRSSTISFDVGPAKAAHAPSVKSMGITGQITGSRGDIIIADDVEVPNNSATQLMRERLAMQIAEFGGAIIKPLESSRIIFLGTPQTEQSIYNSLEDKGYNVRIWPAEVPDARLYETISDRLAPSIVEQYERGVAPGTPTDPTRFDARELEERRLEYGRSGFALQFQLDTTLSDADRYPLKLSDLIVMDTQSDTAPEKVIGGTGPDLFIRDLESPGLSGDHFHRPLRVQGDWIPYQGSVLAIDPSGRGKDETAYCILKMLNGYLYLVESGGILAGYEDSTLEFLAKRAAFHKVNAVIIEANYGGGMFSQLIKPWFLKHHPVHIEEVVHSKQKEVRIIDTLEPVMNQRKLIVDTRVVMHDSEAHPDISPEQNLRYQLFHQMTRITRERACLAQDDRLDCLSIAVAYWTERMGADVDQARELHHEAMVDKEIQEFIENYQGGKAQEPSWLPGR
jgi:hypothetical protein